MLDSNQKKIGKIKWLKDGKLEIENGEWVYILILKGVYQFWIIGEDKSQLWMNSEYISLLSTLIQRIINWVLS